MAGDAPGTAQENPANAGLPAPASPLALYRKYRPATFAEVKGQEHVTGPLTQALRTGRINHAYLFSGPRGCGKTSSARILARSLNCVKGPTPEPCGVCDSCVQAYQSIFEVVNRWTCFTQRYRSSGTCSTATPRSRGSRSP